MKLRLTWLFVSAGFLLGGCGSVSRTTIERGAARAAERRAASVMARDLARDNASRTTRLQTERRVYKYTTESQAREFERKGFPPLTHFSATESSGRPVSGRTAQQRYGLSYLPDRRLGVTLPEGTPIKSNKVVGGSPGYGELRVEKQLPSKSMGSESILKSGLK